MATTAVTTTKTAPSGSRTMVTPVSGRIWDEFSTSDCPVCSTARAPTSAAMHDPQVSTTAAQTRVLAGSAPPAIAAIEPAAAVMTKLTLLTAR